MTNWSKPTRRRFVIVRRRIGTPPTGRSVFGVSSEYGRRRVAQPAARMTAFMEAGLPCKHHAGSDLGYLTDLPVELSPPLPRERLSTDQFLSPGRRSPVAVHESVAGARRDRARRRAAVA